MVKVYSVYDRKLQEFGQLAVSKNDESMRRAVIDNVSGSNTLIEKHAVDFDLMCVGEFEQTNGFLCGLTGPPRLVCNVGELLGASLKVVANA